MNSLQVIAVLSVTVPRKQFSPGSESGFLNRLSDFLIIFHSHLYMSDYSVITETLTHDCSLIIYMMEFGVILSINLGTSFLNCTKN
jgi:hypothetical protein